MVRMHDTTRRRLGLAVFFSLGLAPVFLVGGWCAVRNGSGVVKAEAAELSRRLGLDVQLGGLRHLRPGALLYENLDAADPETGELVFRCRLVEVVRRRRGDRPVLEIVASQPEVQAGALGRIWRRLERALDMSSGPLEVDLLCSASELTLHAETGVQTLAAVAGRLENLPEGARAQLDFRLAGDDSLEPARICVVRNRQTTPPASGFELYTGGSPLPCHLLAMGLDEFEPLGRRCRFRGYLWANQSPDGWQGEITGQLAELDLGRLVSDYFPHHLTGVGEATIQSARFHKGRLEDGAATVSAGPGTIDRTLLGAAVEMLRLEPIDVPVDDGGGSIGYRQMAFSATLDSQGLRLSGRCAASEPGALLCDAEGRAILRQPREQPLPAVALVRALVPHSAVQVPAGLQTDWLLRRLPLPKTASAMESEVPHARLRLREIRQ